MIKAVAKRAKAILERFPEAYRVLIGSKNGQMGQYCEKPPHPQNILDLFQNEWISKLPFPYENLQAGTIDLFEDTRLSWVFGLLENIKGKKVLELGPLEGGHSHMLHKQGAAVTAIEANPRVYLRCLAVKQILDLKHVDFLYGDFTKYLNEPGLSFDFCVASGVLYHMRNPVELIAQLAKSSSTVFVWTHYYDPAICPNHPKLKYNFKNPIENEYKGFRHTLYRHNYGYTGGKKFIGGSAAYSHWLTREDILNAFKHFGLGNIQISSEHDTPHHVHGPSFTFLATR